MSEPYCSSEEILSRDPFSRQLGIVVESDSPGAVRLSLVVLPWMANGFGFLHGGVMFSLADTCLAFASSTRGRVTLAIDANCSFHKTVVVGEKLFAQAREIYLGERIATYGVAVNNGEQQTVASFRGTVYRTSKVLSDLEEEK